MSTLSISSLTKEFLKTQVTHTVNGTTVDPTTKPVEWAFVTSGNPTDTDWVTGDWETTPDGYYARIIVGPGSTKVLAVGTYTAWIRITDNPEVPVRIVGKVSVK